MDRNFQIFEIPKKIIPSLENENNWFIYDDECKRREVYTENILNDIINCIDYKMNLEENKLTIHHVVYNLKYKNYELEKHRDASKYTIIIYLERDEAIKDSFYVNDVLVDDYVPKNDNYKGIIFWDNAYHHGTFKGNGNREVLCFFLD